MKHIIAVASGKGGVGKSTVAANLAVALANHAEGGKYKNKIALIDVDFYGPSIPTLMGGGEIKVDHEEKFIPALKHGVKYISISFFLKNPDDPVIWRGPMFGKAINQLFNDTSWGDVDICIVDMPPGTGDAQLSLSQMISLSGVVMVTTPQEVALSDVRRAVNMFKKVNVEALGVVENMAGYTLPDGSKLDIFGEGGGEMLSRQYNIPFLNSIPINLQVREGGDTGNPIANDEKNEITQIYLDISDKILSSLKTQEGKEGLKVVN